MNIRYKNISVGYLGEKHVNATTNANYYAEFFNQLNKSENFLSDIHIFPQRIPRAGFFEELYMLETQCFKSHFDKKIKIIIQYYKNALAIILKKPSLENVRQYINWSNILLRYCQFQTIIDHFPNNYSGPYRLEIELLKETARIETLLSDDRPVSIDYSMKIADQYLTHQDVTEREKIMILNHIIVTFYRYQVKSSKQHYIFNLCKVLLEYVQKLGTDTFISMLYSSIAYRGIAMAPDFGSDMQTSLLDEAEKLARALRGNTEFEKYVAKDNLYTCLQTMAKWNLFNNNHTKAEDYLIELTKLDLVDSTGHSELGFFYANNNEYDKAAQHFKTALELGPPGVGMNMYYYATCLEKLGNELEAIHYLYESTEIDKQALSPWLDLLNYFSNKKQFDKTRKIANHIFGTSILKEQLEEHEIINIKNFIK